MNLSEPKNIKRSKDSFRRSKSTLSSHSDEDTNINTLKNLRPTMEVCLEDPNGEEGVFNDQFTQDNEDSTKFKSNQDNEFDKMD